MTPKSAPFGAQARHNLACVGVRRTLTIKLALLGALALISLALAPNARAKAPAGYIVTDARTGQAVDSWSAHKQGHPASLTKMMTAYLVFEAIENGKLHFDQRIVVSRHAASMPPARLGLRRGDRITVYEALQAAIVRSANDAAVTLAEAVAKTESAFARRMTAKAEELGMPNTTFRNATGLTARGHLSTPADMAVLARSLWIRFPQGYDMFGVERTKVNGRVLRNTNKLLTWYEGADGIKTGYTSRAGHNLAASARQGRRRVFAIYFGGRSGARRDEDVARLLDLGFAALPPMWADRPYMRPGARSATFTQHRQTRSVAAQHEPQERSVWDWWRERLAARKAGESSHKRVAERPALRPLTTKQAERPAPRPFSPRYAQRMYNDARQDWPTASIEEKKNAQEAPKRLRGTWGVQIGAFHSKKGAQARMRHVAQMQTAGLAYATPLIETRYDMQALEAFYRVKFNNLAKNEATRACAELRGAGLECMVTPPAKWAAR